MRRSKVYFVATQGDREMSLISGETFLPSSGRSVGLSLCRTVGVGARRMTSRLTKQVSSLLRPHLISSVLTGGVRTRCPSLRRGPSGSITDILQQGTQAGRMTPGVQEPYRIVLQSVCGDVVEREAYEGKKCDGRYSVLRSTGCFSIP